MKLEEQGKLKGALEHRIQDREGRYDDDPFDGGNVTVRDLAERKKGKHPLIWELVQKAESVMGSPPEGERLTVSAFDNAEEESTCRLQ